MVAEQALEVSRTTRNTKAKPSVCTAAITIGFLTDMFRTDHVLTLPVMCVE